MTIRPVDENGDILPVLSSADPVRGGRAAGILVRDRLELLAGDWWENPERGNGVAGMLEENRYTEADRQAPANYLASYIRETPGVREVEDVQCFVSGRQLRYACSVRTEEGTAEVTYETEA